MKRENDHQKWKNRVTKSIVFAAERWFFFEKKAPIHKPAQSAKSPNTQTCTECKNVLLLRITRCILFRLTKSYEFSLRPAESKAGTMLFLNTFFTHFQLFKFFKCGGNFSPIKNLGTEMRGVGIGCTSMRINSAKRSNHRSHFGSR